MESQREGTGPNEIPDEPKKSAGDLVHSAVRAAASAIPVIGGPAAELFNAIVAPPLERRREAWLERVADGVRELQDRVEGLTPESLSANEVFVTSLLHATQIAGRTHEDEKLEALRNAVVSSALPGAPDEALQQMFLNYVDDFTPWHLHILNFFDDPGEWMRRKGVPLPGWQAGAPASVLEHCMPELAGRRGFYDTILASLEQRGLLGSGGIHTMTSGPGLFSSRTTTIGKEFLHFVSR
jgi:hypothetical protein